MVAVSSYIFISSFEINLFKISTKFLSLLDFIKILFSTGFFSKFLHAKALRFKAIATQNFLKSNY